ncbi:hypothetical protein HPB52_012972 [Rhipicephalus sanguineus]|uniref:Uncharacterized protein n=1 Tax=Rhipicephalus sanguineus TaxID=34632 RepID=A0A9D4PE34_RHISA|nr:hypothetical protein HPB52_012972 [Rhipicephalus sanguineus]
MLLTTAEALDAPEGSPSTSNTVGRADGVTTATALSPASEAAFTASPKQSQRKADSGAHFSASAASGVTTRTVSQEAGDPYWVLVVVLTAAVLIVTLAASFPYVSK